MNTIPRASGIYKITCVPTGKFYIGSAVNLYNRKAMHWSTAKSGKHKNPYLQNAWNKYGETEFSFEVLELTAKSDLLIREQYWLDETHVCDRKIGFNACGIAGSPLGLKRGIEAKQRMSDAAKRRIRYPNSPEHRNNISLGKKGKYKKPLTIAHRNAISESNIGRKHSAETRKKIGDKHRGKSTSIITQKAQLEAVCKPWIVIDPNGVEQLIVNLEKFCRDNGLVAVCMSNVAHGKQRKHKGWTCRMT